MYKACRCACKGELHLALMSREPTERPGLALAEADPPFDAIGVECVKEVLALERQV